MEDKIAILEILKPQGIKGELKTRPLSDDLEFYNNLKTIYLQGENQKRDVVSLSIREGIVYIFISGIDINKANMLRGKLLYIDRDNLSKNDDEYLIDDILNFDVVFSDNGEFVGVLDDVQNFGSADVFYLKNGKKEILFSNVNDVIAEIDLTNKVIKVDRKKFFEVSV